MWINISFMNYFEAVETLSSLKKIWKREDWDINIGYARPLDTVDSRILMRYNQADTKLNMSNLLDKNSFFIMLKPLTPNVSDYPDLMDTGYKIVHVRFFGEIQDIIEEV